VQGWSPPQLLDLLLKLCHDAMAVAGGAAPRYFPQGSVPSCASPARLRAWSLELQLIARHAAHPWNEGVLADALVAAAARALQPPAPRPGGPRRAGLDTLPA
jgi:DNA polymerase-3 subunit delta'